MSAANSPSQDRTSKVRPCPLCGNNTPRRVGPIVHPKPAMVAGVPLELDDDNAFALFACDRCGFQYRSPAIPDEKLLACYRAAKEDFSGWVVNPHQRRFDMMRQMILAANPPGRRILDVGCFHASFLEYLGGDWQRFGIEPSTGAAKVAKSKGVTVLAPTLDALPPDTPPFDVITAMDLIEHLNEPMAWFRQVHEHLAPNGILLLLSGDTDAWTWKLMGSLYWYCSLPEHCAFFSRRSLEFVGEQLGFAL